MIVGIDEVGRGSWAGPLAVAAVALEESIRIRRLRDSKLVPATERVQLARTIREQAVAIGIGWAPPKYIDAHGITAALRFAGEQALASINVTYERIILDGIFPYIKDDRLELLAKADMTVPSVSAASIIAKVARDSYMSMIAKCHCNYQFERHVGYGTKLHRQLLKQFGPSPIHRYCYKPIRVLLES
jgi:ribonuclease HII